RLFGGLLGELFRRKAVCDEGGLPGHGGVYASAFVPQLVPAELSIRLRILPLREQLKGTFMLIRGDLTPAVNSFPEDVRQGLGKIGQKELPSKYLYDDVGSALFEVITKLPEYGLTRAEERILRGHSEVIAERLASHGMVVELGSGNGRKARRILEALARHQPTTYCPIEISPTALESCERELGDL